MATLEYVKVAPGAVKAGDRIYHDGAYRVVAKVLDCGSYMRFTFEPAWGCKRVDKQAAVHKWAA
jgi:hypothetical protein